MGIGPVCAQRTPAAISRSPACSSRASGASFGLVAFRYATRGTRWDRVSHDLSNLRLTKEKCLPTRLGMSSDHGVLNRGHFRLLLRSHGRKVAVSSRIEIGVVVDAYLALQPRPRRFI